MIKTWRIFCLSLVIFCMSSKGFCSNSNIQEINKQVIEQLIAIEDASILSIENEQEVYLNPSKIIALEEGMFLETQGGEYIRIPLLLSGERGCFTLLANEKQNSVIYPLIKCKGCTRLFTPSIFNRGKCPHCGTQN